MIYHVKFFITKLFTVKITHESKEFLSLKTLTFVFFSSYIVRLVMNLKLVSFVIRKFYTVYFE